MKNTTTLAAVLGAVIGALLLAPSLAGAHVVYNGGRDFYWYLGTRKGDKELDPINLLWNGGAITTDMTQDNVRDVVERNWAARTPGGPAPSRGKMTFGQLCLGQRMPAFDLGKQRARFRADGGRSAQDQQNKFQGSTSSRCFSQWHMRFWDDTTHRSITTGHLRDYIWNLSGVHYDVSTCARRWPHPVISPRFGGCHKVAGRWAAYRGHAVNRGMRHLCGRQRWRRYPGGDRDFQGHRYDGYVGEIKFTYDGRSCPRGLS